MSHILICDRIWGTNIDSSIFYKHVYDMIIEWKLFGGREKGWVKEGGSKYGSFMIYMPEYVIMKPIVLYLKKYF